MHKSPRGAVRAMPWHQTQLQPNLEANATGKHYETSDGTRSGNATTANNYLRSLLFDSECAGKFAKAIDCMFFYSDLKFHTYYH